MQTQIITYRRAVRFVSPAAHGRTWTSECGRYRIRESYLIGEAFPVYYAQIQAAGVWEIAGRHRKRTAAQRTLDRLARRAGRGRR